MAFETPAFNETLSETQVIYRFFSNIGLLGSQIYSDTSLSWQVNARNYVAEINAIEAFVAHYLDILYYKQLEFRDQYFAAILNEYIEKNPGTQTDTGNEVVMSLTLDYANAKLALMQKTLHRKGVYNPSTYQLLSGEEGVDAE